MSIWFRVGVSTSGLQGMFILLDGGPKVTLTVPSPTQLRLIHNDLRLMVRMPKSLLPWVGGTSLTKPSSAIPSGSPTVGAAVGLAEATVDVDGAEPPGASSPVQPAELATAKIPAAKPIAERRRSGERLVI